MKHCKTCKRILEQGFAQCQCTTQCLLVFVSKRGRCQHNVICVLGLVSKSSPDDNTYDEQHNTTTTTTGGTFNVQAQALTHCAVLYKQAQACRYDSLGPAWCWSIIVILYLCQLGAGKLLGGARFARPALRGGGVRYIIVVGCAC